MSEDIAWVLSPVWFLLGLVVAAVVLLGSPNLYERIRHGIMHFKLFCTNKCDAASCLSTTDMDNPVYNPGSDHVTGKVEPVANHNYDYTEIDAQKTQTFMPPKLTQKPRLRYEDCVINRNSHTYSQCRGEVKQKPEDTTNRISAEHNYTILEPGSNVRLPVRMVTEDFVDDPNHVYFRLEPGTNKVILQERVDMDDIKEHTYFVLEANAEREKSTDAIAYEVNELSDHNYYILEKQ